MSHRPFKFRPFELTLENPSAFSMTPGPRSGHRICCDSSNLYVFGGYNFQEDSDDHNLYKEILCFNFASKKWKLINEDNTMDDECPDELASSSMLMYGKTLVVFGGTSYPFGMRCSNRITLISVNADDTYGIKELKTLNEEKDTPPGQYGMSIACRDNYFYTVGGTQGFDYTADIYRINFTTQKWELLAMSRPEINPDEPIGRYRHEIAIDDRYIYIFGGGTSDTVFDLTTLPVYDLIERRWGKIVTYPDPDAGFPPPRKCHSLVQHTTKDVFDTEETCVYVAGGNYQGGPLNDVWKLSLTTRRWMRFRQTGLRTSLFFHDACITPEGCMYIFGGITAVTTRTNKLFKMWVTLPKLSEIAWEALVHYFPRIYQAPKNYMLEKGVPIRYVERVHP